MVDVQSLLTAKVRCNSKNDANKHIAPLIIKEVSMVGPGFRVKREPDSGLWEATTSFAVKVGDKKCLLAPATAVVYTRQSPLPDPASQCHVGGIGHVPFDPHFSPRNLVAGQFEQDFVPILIPEAQLSSDIPNLGHPMNIGDAANPALQSVKVAVSRDSNIVTLDAVLSNLSAPATRIRVIQPSGGLIGVTYSSIFRLELQDATRTFVMEDSGAPIIRVEDNGSLTTVGVILFCDHPQRALVTNIQLIFDFLPFNSSLL